MHPQVTEKLREQLGAGWVVEEMTHDDSRHPCKLVEELASVDVLLTAHGFQVRRKMEVCMLPFLLLYLYTGWFRLNAQNCVPD